MDNGELIHENPIPNHFDGKGYGFSGKIMLSAIIILFFVAVFMLCLHLYARWYLHSSHRRHIRRRLRRRTNLVFYLDSDHPAAASVTLPSRGLEASVIASLPVFAYDPNTRPENPAECAVCLSEFESGETGRVLPKCNHVFHTDCIDMWFHSHSTCPLCRAPVEPVQGEETRPEVVINVSEPGPASSSGLEENRIGRQVSSLRRKPSSLVGVTVEVPPRNEGFRDESGSGCDSPSTQLSSSSFRSPMSRMLSFKRILSRERRGSVSPSSGGGCSSSAAELNAERGGRDETQ